MRISSLNPTTLAFHDVNQDGLRQTWWFLIPYEKIKVLLQVPEKDFDEEDVAPPGSAKIRGSRGSSSAERGRRRPKAGIVAPRKRTSSAPWC